jgi:hypothetical protein
MIGNTIPIPMASIIKVVRMKRKGPVSFIPLTNTLKLLLITLEFKTEKCHLKDHFTRSQ